MTDTAHILTVSRLNALLKETVEENFVQVWVEGEISNFATPASGHWYFSLKDETAQIRAVMFRAQSRLTAFKPDNGLKIICRGRVSLYPQRGELQLIVDAMEPKGVGSLQLAFEQLKQRLSAEGLFDPSKKRALPPFPKTIGVVTSATGAAIHDILTVLRRRAAGVRVLLRPVRVQGDGAWEEIVEAIADLNRHGEADVLIVGRGGGSLEDLWAFNEEMVVRAIHASEIPVISAVGHEVDVTIADFAADLRAPTPSAAAELVVKNRQELEGHIDHLLLQLAARIHGRLSLLQEKVSGLALRLRSPVQVLELMRQKEENLRYRLNQAMDQYLEGCQKSLATLSAHLNALSPLQTLARGYAIVFRENTSRPVRSSDELNPGDQVQLRLGKGAAEACIKKIVS